MAQAGAAAAQLPPLLRAAAAGDVAALEANLTDATKGTADTVSCATWPLK
jgi:hypothetical protein